jgi:ketosteroid isomerase-like protein
VQAFLKNDTSTLERYYADDYISIPANGRRLTKSDEIDNFRSGAVRYESITVRDSTVRTYGDTAIVNLLLSVKVISGGKKFDGDFRNTRVWVKQKGSWKVVAFQATRVASQVRGSLAIQHPVPLASSELALRLRPR